MNNEVQVDLITNTGNGLKGSGRLAQRLLQGGFNVNVLRTNDVLRNREWIQFDTALIAVARQRLVAVADLMSAGLTYPIANALGVTKVEWEQISDFGDAQVNMSGVAEGINDRMEFNLNSIPLPIVHKDFNINIRALAASRNLGQPLDTTQLELAGRIVVEKIENMLFIGGSTYGANGTIYGYTNAPNALTGTLSADWSSATNGSAMLTDVIAMTAALAAKNMYGPYMLYVPWNYYIAMTGDLKANSDRSIIERLKVIPMIKDIRPTSNLTGKVVMVQMTKDVVDMIDGIQPTIVSWDAEGGMIVKFKIMAIMVPRVKTDYTAQTGIAVYSYP